MGKKKRRQASRLTNFDTVTIAQFANSQHRLSSSNRVPKFISQPAKLANGQDTSMVSESDTAEDDSSQPCVDNGDATVNQDDNINTAILKPNADCDGQTSVDQEKRRIYPFCLWDLLSNYIVPESVSSFSLICHDAYAVTNQYSFWVRLYRRNYQHTPLSSWPKELMDPELVARQPGLRAYVIRALFLTYKPFHFRIQSLTLESHSPHVVANGVCLEWWQRRRRQQTQSRKPGFNFFFKLLLRPPRRPLWKSISPASLGDSSSYRRRKCKKVVADTWDEVVDDWDDFQTFYPVDELHVNPDEQCAILELDAHCYSRIPSDILGLRLVDVCLTMSGEGFRYHKLVLKFVPSHLGASNQHGDSCVTAVVNEIQRMRVHKWYHPNYTYCQKV